MKHIDVLDGKTGHIIIKQKRNMRMIVRYVYSYNVRYCYYIITSIIIYYF